ncbi:alpha/beta hydrolase [Actinoplanes sp. NPDC049599]|uniref:alpha/beta hydrolase n=1 Tax=Actinoplanes sp. NPDC049599 TaxID=3363903 RepID=UPI0037BCD62F
MPSGILIPGSLGTVQTTLLDLAWEALTDRRALIEEVTWTTPEGLVEAGPEPFVRACVAAALHRLKQRDPEARPVLIAKSLGTHASGLAADHELPAIWLTPLLHLPSVVAAITRNPAPQLLIGGTADASWLPAAANSTGAQLLTIPDAGHSLRPPGNLRDFATALATIGTAIETFLNTNQP